MKKKRRISFAAMTLILALMLSSTGFAYAAAGDGTKDPIREVHKVAVGNTMYCFFVENNVVMTPAEISGMTDEELVLEILDRAGLYMKKANCKLSVNKVISVKKWTNKGSFLLSESDIESLRQAAPSDGSPVKLYMDLRLTTEPYYTDTEDSKDADTAEAAKDAETAEEKAEAAEDTAEKAETAEDTEEKAETAEAAEATEEQKEKDLPDVYSTYKLTSPSLLFVTVATKNDASTAEDICKESNESSNQYSNKNNSSTDSFSGVSEESGVSDEETLPELKTIKMTDRSGKPVKDTLEDGDPVTLEWNESGSHADGSNSKSFAEYIPGGYIGLAAAVIVAAAVIAAMTASKKKKSKNKDIKGEVNAEETNNQ